MQRRRVLGLLLGALERMVRDGAVARHDLVAMVHRLRDDDCPQAAPATFFA